MSQFHQTRPGADEDIEGLNDMLEEVNTQLFADIWERGERAKRTDRENQLLQAWLNKLKGILAEEVDAGRSVLHDHFRIDDLEEAVDRQVAINQSTNDTLRMLIDEVKELKARLATTEEVEEKPDNVIHIVPPRKLVVIDEDVQPILIEFLNWLYEVWLEQHPEEFLVSRREKVLGDFLVFRAHRFGEE